MVSGQKLHRFPHRRRQALAGAGGAGSRASMTALLHLLHEASEVGLVMSWPFIRGGEHWRGRKKSIFNHTKPFNDMLRKSFKLDVDDIYINLWYLWNSSDHLEKCRQITHVDDQSLHSDAREKVPLISGPCEQGQSWYCHGCCSSRTTLATSYRCYPLVICYSLLWKIDGPCRSWIYLLKWWVSIAMLVCQRVTAENCAPQCNPWQKTKDSQQPSICVGTNPQLQPVHSPIFWLHALLCSQSWRYFSTCFQYPERCCQKLKQGERQS